MQRYSRGLSGQGGSTRSSWSSGAVRAASPEPGGNTVLTADVGVSNERLISAPNEVLQDLEKENLELKNLLQLKDQRIAELSRSDTHTLRLKKDIRMLAAELHDTRKQLRESNALVEDFRVQRAKLQTHRPTTESSTSTEALDGKEVVRPSPADRAAATAFVELEAENQRLRLYVNDLQLELAKLHPQHLDSLRASVAAQQPRPLDLQNSISSTTGSTRPASSLYQDHDDEYGEMVVYSSQRCEHATRLGRMMLQGLGIVEGSSHAAKVLLSRINSSVYCRQAAPSQAQGLMSLGQMQMRHSGMMPVMQGQMVQLGHGSAMVHHLSHSAVGYPSGM